MPAGLYVKTTSGIGAAPPPAGVTRTDPAASPAEAPAVDRFTELRAATEYEKLLLVCPAMDTVTGAIVYITHEEVTGVKPTLADLREVLKDLQKYNLVVAICRINFLVTIGTTEEILSREQQVCDLVFDTLRENLNRLRKKFERRVVFNRISLLFVLKQALLSAPENGAPLKPNLEQLGRAVLIANDLIITRRPTKNDSTLEQLHNFILFRDYFPRDAFIRDAARTAIMFNEIGQHLNKPPFDLAAAFTEKVGVSFEKFVALTWGIYSHYLRISESGFNEAPELYTIQPDFFKNTCITSDEAKRYLATLSKSQDEYKMLLQTDGNKVDDDLMLFHRYPLIETPFGGHVGLDPQFVVEKAGRGVYWTLFYELGNKERLRLAEFWGAVFEAYVNMQMVKVCDSTKFIPKPTFADGTEAADACLQEDRNLIIFEHKSSVLKVTAKYSPHPEDLAAELGLKFIQGDEKGKKGVAQMLSSLTKFLEGQAIAGIRPQQVSRVYPVMVCLDESMASPLMTTYLNEHFGRRRLGKKKTITPLFIITVSNLEEFLPHLGSVAFHQILESHYAEDRRLVWPLTLSTAKVLQPKNRGRDLLGERLVRLGQEMTGALFPHEIQNKLSVDSSSGA